MASHLSSTACRLVTAVAVALLLPVAAPASAVTGAEQRTTFPDPTGDVQTDDPAMRGVGDIVEVEIRRADGPEDGTVELDVTFADDIRDRNVDLRWVLDFMHRGAGADRLVHLQTTVRDGVATVPTWETGGPAPAERCGTATVEDDGRTVAVTFPYRDCSPGRLSAVAVDVFNVSVFVEPCASCSAGSEDSFPDGGSSGASVVGPAGPYVAADQVSPWDADPTTTDQLLWRSPITAAIETSRTRYPEWRTSGGVYATTGPAAGHATLARSDIFPDALSSVGLTHTGPLLFTDGRTLDPATLAELERVLRDGDTVYLLGGDAAISPTVADQVAAAGFEPVRLAGADRIETSVEVAHENFFGDVRPVSYAHVRIARAYGPDGGNTSAAWADAVAGQMHDARGPDAPLLLTRTEQLDPRVAGWLKGAARRIGGVTVSVLGGDAAISPTVVNQLEALPGVEVLNRVAGVNRFDTAAKASDHDRRYVLVDGTASHGWWHGLLAAGLASDLGGGLLYFDGDRLPDETAAVVSGCRRWETALIVTSDRSDLAQRVEDVDRRC